MNKTFVLDTNVLLSDPNCLSSFDNNDLIIPMVVLEELDAHKGRQDEVGRNARHISRLLDDMRKPGQSLDQGIKLPSGGSLRVISVGQEILTIAPAELKTAKVDNMIIAFMLHLRKTLPESVLVSKDINVRLKCDSLGIKCDDYLKMRIANDPKKFYRGVEVIHVSENVVDQFFNDGMLSLKHPELLTQVFYPNQIVIIKYVSGDQTKSAVTRVVGDDLVPVPKVETICGLKPRNKEQTFSLDLLLDPNVKFVTLVGQSGTGKTLLALAAALSQLKSMPKGKTESLGKYDKLIVTKPIQAVGKDIGFLPGTLEEKMEPWVAPIRDNLNFLMGSKPQQNGRRKAFGTNETYLSMLQEQGIVEIEAITFIRGRSIPNAFIIIDEAQNLSMHELKTIVTRVGDGTKIVLTGDIEQIDNVHVDAYTNGLTYAVEKFKEYDIAGHVTLIKGERSELATLASQIL